jgi:hypothetical protein
MEIAGDTIVCKNTTVCTFTTKRTISYEAEGPFLIRYRAGAITSFGDYSYTEGKDLNIRKVDYLGRDGEPPEIKLEFSKYIISPTEKLTVKATVTDNVGVSKIDLIVEGKTVKTCSNVGVCEVTVGPFSSEKGVVDVEAYAYDKAGNRDWTARHQANVFSESDIQKQDAYLADELQKARQQTEQMIKGTETNQSVKPTVVEPTKPVVSEIVLNNGDIFKSPLHTSVYYYENGLRRPFVNSAVYYTWFSNFKDVKNLKVDQVEGIKLGNPMPIKAGTKLLKFPLNPKVYEVTEGSTIKHVPDETTAKAKYGTNWNKNVIELPEIYYLFYNEIN